MVAQVFNIQSHPQDSPPRRTVAMERPRFGGNLPECSNEERCEDCGGWCPVLGMSMQQLMEE